MGTSNSTCRGPGATALVEVLRTYARPTAEIDRVILAGFVLGLSTRKVGEALPALLGQPVSAATMSQVRYYLPGTQAAMLVRKPSNIFVPSSSRRDTDCCANAVCSFNASAGSVH